MTDFLAAAAAKVALTALEAVLAELLRRMLGRVFPIMQQVQSTVGA